MQLQQQQQQLQPFFQAISFHDATAQEQLKPMYLENIKFLHNVVCPM